MRTDSRDRRLRFERSPRDKSLALKARDLAIFEAIHRHGPLPSNYLFEFTRKYSGSQLHLKHRLTKLFHGLADGTHFLDRPPQQYQSCMARAQPSIYDLAPSAKILLAEAARLSPFVGTRTDPFLHRFMSACVSASVELACRSNGIRYIHRHEIFSHSKCPEPTRNRPNPLSLPAGGKRIVPDDLFGLDYGGKFRFFAVEVDRNTESIERRDVGQTAFGKKLHAYGDLLERGTFRNVWGIPNLLILTVTTNATHMANMVAYASATMTAHQQKFLFKAKPGFGMNWTVPAVMDDLVTAPWARVLAPLNISQA
jgi:hypothetical protein